MNQADRLLFLTLIYVSLSGSVITIALLTVVLRRLRAYHYSKMKQSVDIAVDHQQMNQAVASTMVVSTAKIAEGVKDKADENATAVREKVVEEAALVKQKVESAADRAESGFLSGADRVNTKLDLIGAQIIADHGADEANKKLDTLLVKSTEPIPVEVVNVVETKAAEAKKRSH